jgi:hypothetical protein
MSKEISDEHIRVAAYYIWAAEGFPEGMAEVHWERARVALALLAAESTSPDEDSAVPEKAAEIADTAPEPTTEPAARRPPN